MKEVFIDLDRDKNCALFIPNFPTNLRDKLKVEAVKKKIKRGSYHTLIIKILTEYFK